MNMLTSFLRALTETVITVWGKNLPRLSTPEKKNVKDCNINLN